MVVRFGHKRSHNERKIVTSKAGRAVKRRFIGHAADCTIYASLVNGTPLDGICTCGYGWQCVRRDDWGKMFSAEWLEANKSTKTKG